MSPPRQRRRARPPVPAAALLQRLGERRAQRVQRGREAEEECRRERERDREGDRAAVHGRGESARHVRGQPGLQQVEARLREQQAQARRGEREDEALGEELPREPAAAGAERRADGHLAVTALGAGEEQVRHVGARDQHQEPHRAREQQQRGAPRADDLVVEAHRERGELHLAREGTLVRQLAGDAAQVVVGAGDGGARGEARDRVVAVAPVVGPELLGLGRARHPQLRRVGRVLAEVGGQREAARHDAHDLVRHAVDLDRAADHRRVARVASLPQRVAEDSELRPARPVLRLREAAPEERRDAERLERVRRDLAGGDPHGLAVAREVAVGRRPERHRREARTAVGVAARLVRVRPRLLEPAPAAPHHHAVLRVGVRQRLEHHRVEHREDGRVRGHAEGERQHRDGRERRRAEKDANGVAQVLQQGLHGSSSYGSRSTAAGSRRAARRAGHADAARASAARAKAVAASDRGSRGFVS